MNLKLIITLFMLLLMTGIGSAKYEIPSTDDLIIDATVIVDGTPQYMHFENNEITSIKLTGDFKPDYKIIITQKNYDKSMEIFESYKENGELLLSQKITIFKMNFVTPIYKYTYNDGIVANTSHLPVSNMNFPAKIYTLIG